MGGHSESLPHASLAGVRRNLPMYAREIDITRNIVPPEADQAAMAGKVDRIVHNKVAANKFLDPASG